MMHVLVNIRPSTRVLGSSTFVWAAALGWMLLNTAMALGALRLTHGPLAWAAVGLTVVTFLRPTWGIATLLALLPIFGNKPVTPQSWALVLFGSALNVGLVARQLWAPAERREASQNAMVVLLGLYGVASALSVSALPLAEIWRDTYAQVGGALDPIAYIVTLLHADETEPIYSLYSVVMTLYAIALAVFVRGEVRSTPGAGVLISNAVLIGLIAALVIGLLDYYYVIDLRPLRDLDPIVNPRGVQDRLQSTFGHSGWLAEYVTMAVPYCMVVLLAPTRYAFRLAAILLLLLVGEFTLILTYQRGGWLSYPFALFVIWLSIYHMGARDNQTRTVTQTLRQSALKIAISLPLTVLISLGLLYVCVQAGWLGPKRDVDLTRYVDRAAQLTRASDRTTYIATGFRLGTLHPILGAGSESFGFSYYDEFVRPGGAFYDNGRHPLGLIIYGSAHNVYAQTFAGKGAVGLALLLGLIGTVLIGGPRLLLSQHDLSAERRLLLLIAISSTFAFATYGLVQEVFYIQSLQYLVFAAWGLFAAVVEPRLRFSVQLRRTLWLLLAAALAAHLTYEYVYPGPTRDRNFWREAARRGWTLGMTEIDRQGIRFRWSGARATLAGPADATWLVLPLRSTAPEPQRVEIRLDGAFVDSVRLEDHAWRTLRYPLPRASWWARRRIVELRIQPTWRAPNDGRDLGVMVGSYFWINGKEP
jgi:O-Antigen ligase